MWVVNPKQSATNSVSALRRGRSIDHEEIQVKRFGPFFFLVLLTKNLRDAEATRLFFFASPIISFVSVVA